MPLTHRLANELILSPQKRLQILRDTPPELRGKVLLSLSKPLQHELLKRLTHQEVADLIHFMDADEVADLLQNMEAHHRTRIVAGLVPPTRDKVEFLLRFNPNTAAGIMSLNYELIDQALRIAQVIELVQRHEKKPGQIPTLLVADHGKPVGELLVRDLLFKPDHQNAGSHMKKVPTISFDVEEAKVVDVFKSHHCNKLVVLDEQDKVMGVIYYDDALRLIQKQAAQSLSRFAGVSAEEDVFDSALLKVRYRYKWLIINLFTEFLAAGVVSLFQGTISAFTLLAVYMPMVAGMGGNAGTQTLAVMVRGLALKEIDAVAAKRVVVRELIAGGINGVINGLIVAGVAVFWNHSPLLGVAIGLAMVINLLVAGFFGATVPLLMKALGRDPASSATIFITTATDVFGFFSFLWLASLLMAR